MQGLFLAHKYFCDILDFKFFCIFMAERTRSSVKRKEKEEDPVGWAIERMEDVANTLTREEIAMEIGMKLRTLYQ